MLREARPTNEERTAAHERRGRATQSVASKLLRGRNGLEGNIRNWEPAKHAHSHSTAGDAGNAAGDALMHLVRVHGSFPDTSTLVQSLLVVASSIACTALLTAYPTAGGLLTPVHAPSASAPLVPADSSIGSSGTTGAAAATADATHIGALVCLAVSGTAVGLMTTLSLGLIGDVCVHRLTLIVALFLILLLNNGCVFVGVEQLYAPAAGEPVSVRPTSAAASDHDLVRCITVDRSTCSLVAEGCWHSVCAAALHPLQPSLQSRRAKRPGLSTVQLLSMHTAVRCAATRTLYSCWPVVASMACCMVLHDACTRARRCAACQQQCRRCSCLPTSTRRP